MGVKRYFMNEKEADVIRKSMYESLLMDENDKIVHWDFDPMRRELREYVDIACGCDEQTYGIRTPQFVYRYCTGKIKMPFAKSDYLANDDIIATVMGLGLDVEKFWFVLLFIYDMTMDRALSSAEFRKSDYEVLTEIKEYLEKHANARLYLSDDREIPKDNRCETNNPVIIGQMLKYVKRYLARFERRPEQKEWVSTSFHRGFDKSLSSTHQQVFMYNQFKTLFDALKLPEKRAKKGETVSYSKMLLASRLIYFCRITKNESFTVDSSSLKGVLKDYANYPFDETPKVYR